MASTSSAMNGRVYDVFLSFRGADTRNNFTSHLYNALCKEGVNAFMDKELKRGEEISSTLFLIIECSKVSIVVFSPNYASSKFCLDELVKILECKPSRRQVVLPVFYKVDPFEVEKQTGRYGKAISSHEAEFKGIKGLFYGKKTIKEKMEKVRSWKLALAEAADLSGWDLHNRDEAEIIQEIVEDVLQKLNRGRPEKSLSEEKFALNAPQTSVEIFPAKRLVGKEFQSNMELVWTWLTTGDVSSIGICGMGGVGKTTMLINIHNKLLANVKEFGRVFWVTVSQDFSIYKLQNLIGKAIGLEFGSEDDVMKRAARLSKALLLEGNLLKEKMKSQEENLPNPQVILILDDLWNHFDAKKVGIPIEEEGCKLIVTTRSLDVCTRMGLQKIKKIEPLSENEAWCLFTETLGHDLAKNVEVIAKSVARECAGLPLGIVTMAGSMRGVDDVHEWNNALSELQRSEVRPEDMGDEVFRILRFSYTRLNDCALQQCFLYCALFPEDYKIHRREPIEFLIAEGIIERQMSRQQDFDKAHAMLNKLVKVSLLEDFTEKNGIRYLKMHDLIRDMAIQIIKVSSPSIVEAGMQLKDLPEEKYWTKETVRVSLMNNDMDEFPTDFSPVCPNLSTLLLSRNTNLISIPDSFFHQLQGLKVLDLSYTAIKRLPESVSCLENLNMLLLRECKNLSDMPSLVKLVSLEVLDLYCCDAIKQVPEGLELLSNLKFLNLFGTGIKNLQAGMLTRLSRLQFLTINGLFEAASGVKAEDLAALRKLESLYWRFHDSGEYNKYVQLVSRAQIGRKLMNYFLSVGEAIHHQSTSYYKDGPCSREVVFQGCVISRELLIQKDLQILTIQCVTINDGSGLRFKTATQMDSSQAELKFLIIGYCEGIEYLFYSSSSPLVLQNLETLELCSLPKLHAVFGSEVDPPPAKTPLLPCVTTFSSLRRFSIAWCRTMKKLFPPHLVSNFINLEEIVVKYCLDLEEIVASTDDEASYGHNHSHSMERPHLKLPKLRSFTLVQLPKLKSIASTLIVCNSQQEITIRNCKELKKMPFSLPLPSLQTLSVWPRDWWESVEWGNQHQQVGLRPQFD